jgi:hypothetical protein
MRKILRVKDMKKVFACAAVIVLQTGMLMARPQAPTTYNTYDGFAPGGRAMAMGLAYTALSEDSAGVYFNPAALARVTGNSVGITYEAARQSSLNYDEIFGSEVLRNKKLVFVDLTGPKGSFSWRPLADAKLRTENGANFDDTEIKTSAYTFSAGQAQNEKFSYGLNLSYLNGEIGHSSIENGVPSVNISAGYGMSADFGMLYVASPNLRLGLTLKNIAGFLWWDDYEADQLPFAPRAGLALLLSGTLTIAADWDRSYYRGDPGPVDMTHVGIEQRVGAVSLCAGMYGTNLDSQDATHTTAGLGYQISKYKLFVAGEKYKVDSADVYRFVFSLDLPI